MSNSLKGLLSLIMMISVFILASIPAYADSTIDLSGEISLKNGVPYFWNESWFNQTLNQIESNLYSKGYTDSNTNSLGKSIGVATYESSKNKPRDITVFFDLSSKKPSSISIIYSSDSDTYNSIANGLDSILGESVYHEASQEKNGGYTIEYAEHLTWSGNGYSYKINAEGGEKLSGLYQVQTGKCPFVLSITPDGSTPATKEDTSSRASVAALENAINSIVNSASSSSSTPQKLDITISSVKIGKDSIGTPQVHIVFKNTSPSKSIDRIDFAVRCFDAYGTELLPYGFYRWTDCFYDDKELRPGKTTPTDWRWTIYGVDGTKSVRIAITKYHTTDGKTV